MTSDTENIDSSLSDLDLRPTSEILSTLLESQQQALSAVHASIAALTEAVDAAAERLAHGQGRLVMAGAGASGRLAVQDGAEMWPTYGWPDERLILLIAGGNTALTKSVEGVEDDGSDAQKQVDELAINEADVVVALAASGHSRWTVELVRQARIRGAMTIGVANNDETPLLTEAEFAIFLASGREVLAGSTRMAAGTSQKVLLNLFSTALMIRLNRTFGNLMVDMAAVNRKLDSRRVRMLTQIVPDISEQQAGAHLAASDGWVKLAALLAQGVSDAQARRLLEQCDGSLRAALQKTGKSDP